MADSRVEHRATHFSLGQHAPQDRSTTPAEGVPRPGEGEATEPGGPVNWRGMTDDEYEDTFGALCDFLAWAVPHWAFTTEQFPYHCWWQHSDISEEMTAWWGLWQAYIRNPAANIADPTAFHDAPMHLNNASPTRTAAGVVTATNRAPDVPRVARGGFPPDCSLDQAEQ